MRYFFTFLILTIISLGQCDHPKAIVDDGTPPAPTKRLLSSESARVADSLIGNWHQKGTDQNPSSERYIFFDRHPDASYSVGFYFAGYGFEEPLVYLHCSPASTCTAQFDVSGIDYSFGFSRIGNMILITDSNERIDALLTPDRKYFR